MLKISNANCTLEELYNIFRRFGKITLNCVRGYALVRFEDEETAKRAMKYHNGLLVHKKKLIIKPYRGGPLDNDDPEMELEKNAGEQLANKLAENPIDRIHEEALNRIKDFRPNLEDLVRAAAEGIETALKSSLENMVAENLAEEEQKTRVDEYCSMYDRELSKLTERLKPILSKLVKRLATFDKKVINLEQPVESLGAQHLITNEVRSMEVKKPFYETGHGNGPVKKMVAVSDSNFIACFSEKHCCKYYRHDDFKPIFSLDTGTPESNTVPSALVMYHNQDRHYCVVGDYGGRLSVVKIHSIEKQYTEFNMHKNIITDIKKYRDNQFMSCSSDKYIRCWKV